MLFLDTSALVKRYVDEEGTNRVIRQMDDDREWAASAACLCEAHVTLCRRFGPGAADTFAGALFEDWQRFLVVPVDDACLMRAAEIGCEQDVRTLDAIHLAAAERLPRPMSFVTFDKRQRDAAEALGLRLEA